MEIPTYRQLRNSPEYNPRDLENAPGLYVIQPDCRDDFKTIKFGIAFDIKDMMKMRYSKAYSGKFDIHFLLYSEYERVQMIEKLVKKRIITNFEPDDVLSNSGEYFVLTPKNWKRFKGYLDTAILKAMNTDIERIIVNPLKHPNWVLLRPTPPRQTRNSTVGRD